MSIEVGHAKEGLLARRNTRAFERFIDVVGVMCSLADGEVVADIRAKVLGESDLGEPIIDVIVEKCSAIGRFHEAWLAGDTVQDLSRSRNGQTGGPSPGVFIPDVVGCVVPGFIQTLAHNAAVLHNPLSLVPLLLLLIHLAKATVVVVKIHNVSCIVELVFIAAKGRKGPTMGSDNNINVVVMTVFLLRHFLFLDLPSSSSLTGLSIGRHLLKSLAAIGLLLGRLPLLCLVFLHL